MMKFEVKTDQNRFSDKLSFVLVSIIVTFITFLLINISLSLNKLSRNLEINYFCKLLLIDKSQISFRKLSRLTNQLNKQKVWDFCREFTK